MKRDIKSIIIGIFIFAAMCGISFLLTSGIYYLFTLIMSTFFSIVIPFTWHYALGVWLIFLLINLLFGGVKLSVER